MKKDKKIEKILEYYNLLDMLKEIDLEKNTKEDIREVLNYIAKELEKYVNLMEVNNVK